MGAILTVLIPLLGIITHVTQWTNTPGVGRNELAARNQLLEQRIKEMEAYVQRANEAVEKMKSPPSTALALSDGELQRLKDKMGFHSEHYNFAVAGESGKGKSSIINAIAQKKLCKVGEIETTRIPQEVKLSDHLSLWDLPGGNTMNHPAATYVDDFGLKAFDVVILVTDNRFTEFDVGLQKILSAAGVPVFLVRNKADQAFQSLADRMDLSNDSPVEDLMKVMDTIRRSVTQYAMHNFPKNVPLYIVSARHMMYPAKLVYGIAAIQFDESKFLTDVAMAGTRRA